MTDGEQPDDWAARLDAAEQDVARREASVEQDGRPTGGVAFAEERDKIGEERDALARLLDELATSRDEKALRRDVRASHRDQHASRVADVEDPGFADRFLSAGDRDFSAGDRADSYDDRHRAARERDKATAARRKAADDREAARSAAQEAESTAADLRAGLASGATVGQAQGRIMQRYAISAEGAQEMLTELAKRQDVDLQEIAERIARLGLDDLPDI